MNPIFLASLRRHWRILGALSAFLVFTVVHFTIYRPVANRYRAAIASVGGVDAFFNPGRTSAMLPPRVYALLAENSLTPQDAQERGSSGALGVLLLEDLGRIAHDTGLQITASEPGLVTQEALTTQVRARLVMSGRYDEIVGFFDALSRSSSLLSVERFAIRTREGADDQLELWVARLYLKQESAGR